MKSCLKISLSILIIVFSFSFIPTYTKAETKHLVINEIYYDVINEPEEEWIEIYNPTDKVMDLSGFKIGDEETKGGREGMYQFPKDSTIEAKSYLIIANKAVSFFNLYGRNPDFELSEEDDNVSCLVKYSAWATGSMNLSNTGDEILLLDDTDQIIDVVVYGNGDYPGVIPNFKVPEGHSLERSPKGEDNFIDQSQPSPGVGLEKIEYSKNIFINELFPHPSTGTDSEFIELFNNSGKEADLSGWILDDEEGGSSPYLIPTGTIIKADSYFVFYKKETKLALNDEGDQARLFWPDNNLISFSEVYSKADYDISWSRNLDGSWVFSTTPTPWRANVFTSKQDEIKNIPVMPIKEAKIQPKNSWVKVSGIVTAAPGLFGKRVIYIQDESGGIKIYFDKALWPDLKIGDKITIYGKISLVSGEYEIKVYDTADITVIGNETPPKPIEKKIGELDSFIGQIVQVSGQVTKISGSSAWINDGSGTLRIYFYPATGIKKLGLQKGDALTIIGILSKTSAGLRLLPRSKNDIEITKQEPMTIGKDNETFAQQILGVEKVYAASDYRNGSQPAQIKKKFSILWGVIILIIALCSLASLVIFAKIREKYGKDDQFF